MLRVNIHRLALVFVAVLITVSALSNHMFFSANLALSLTNIKLPALMITFIVLSVFFVRQSKDQIQRQREILLLNIESA